MTNESRRTPVLSARDLVAEGKQGTIFGPLSLDLYAGDLCVVGGARGAGKSAFLMALAGRFRGVSGELTINGIDALARPYEAMDHTAVARLGNFVAPEDRLTVAESISERAFLDGISLKDAEKRLRAFEELVGVRVERGVEIEDLDPVTRAVGSVALVALRPASVVVVDDVDIMVPHADQPVMYEMLAKLTSLDDMVVVASAIDADTAPVGSVRVRLASRLVAHTHPIEEDSAELSIVEEAPTNIGDPFSLVRAGDVVVERIDDEAPPAGSPATKVGDLSVTADTWRMLSPHDDMISSTPQTQSMSSNQSARHTHGEHTNRSNVKEGEQA
ncbi:ATP-binding cassette domain-containing protein [Arcanobacterium haemolyticum]|nr:ATP-binding cassette domain-containing protein [Arcanobacterium haemolyticum]